MNRKHQQPVLWNHDTAIFDASGAEFPDEMYHVRAHAMTRPGDVIQLDSSLNGAVEWATEHYRRVGLPVATKVVHDLSFSVADRFPDYRLDPFIFDSRAHAVRPDRRWHDIVLEMNDKNQTLRRASYFGVPYPKTELFDDKSELGDLQRFTFPLFLKRAVSLAGIGVWRCNSPSELEARLREIPKGVALQLQQPVLGKFLNVSYFAPGDGTFRRVLVSEQILEGPCHVGNRPTYHMPWGLTDPLAIYMASMGMKGYFAFDVVVTPGGDYLLIECNPRWNGSCYPTEVAERLRILSGSNWIARNMKTSHRDVTEIDLGGCEYNPDRKQGVVVLNYGTVREYGKVGLMIVGSPSDIRLYEEALPRILGQ